MVTTWKRFSQTYGRFEIKARMPDVKVAGIHSAIWLWPQDEAKRGGKPMAGEIDIAEYYSVHPDRLIPYVHYTPAAPDPAVTNNECLVDDPAAWHTYLLEWTPKTLTISYDGKTCLVNSWNPAAPLAKPAPFDQPFIIALTQSLGVATTANQPDAGHAVAGHHAGRLRTRLEVSGPVCAPDRNRTCGLPLRRRSLYPTELRGREDSGYPVLVPTHTIGSVCRHLRHLCAAGSGQ